MLSKQWICSIKTYAYGLIFSKLKICKISSQTIINKYLWSILKIGNTNSKPQLSKMMSPSKDTCIMKIVLSCYCYTLNFINDFVKICFLFCYVTNYKMASVASWPTKHKIFTVWLCIENVCQSWVYYIAEISRLTCLSHRLSMFLHYLCF